MRILMVAALLAAGSGAAEAQPNGGAGAEPPEAEARGGGGAEPGSVPETGSIFAGGGYKPEITTGFEFDPARSGGVEGQPGQVSAGRDANPDQPPGGPLPVEIGQ
jgi:hypothetical protein